MPAISVAAESGRKIEEVIVTAERKEASIQDTSISISAFTDQFLDDFGIRNQEDLQNFVPATTIQPYDATIRGVGRNFRALGGDPGVSTYMNGVYSEDLLTATAATFWDVERIEVLRGPQGTLYGRNAVGGAINILYKEPTDEWESGLKAISGNFDTREFYGMLSGPIFQDKLSFRINGAIRDRDGVIDDLGGSDDIDGLGTRNVAVLLKWTPTANLEVNYRKNWMQIDRSFGGANGAGLVVLNEEDGPTRNTEAMVPGYRFVDLANTNSANQLDNNWYDPTMPVLEFTNPVTGATDLAQANRLGIDPGDFDGFQNAAASIDGFGVTSPESAARYNACVFPDKIKGKDLCAATNGLNNENFKQGGHQFNVVWDATDWLQLKYIFGNNTLSYKRTTDDDNTASKVIDRQFYVNHEADYTSHELQAFYDITDNVTVTSGIFFYDARIDQRGDFYPQSGGDRFKQPYVDTTGAYDLLGNPPMVNLYSAKEGCNVDNPAPSCERNYALDNSPNNNLKLGTWQGDDGSDGRLNVLHGDKTVGTDLLYATRTDRNAFALYTQGVWDINQALTLTLGIRYAEDEVLAEENLFRYTESTLGFIDNVALNQANGGIVQDSNGMWQPVEDKATNGGIPISVSVYRPFKRTDDKITWRANLDWNINDSAMMYFSATTGYRSGGYNLVFFSQTPAYDPEELIAYEIGYKTQFLDDTLQLNGSFYYYDYKNIHTVATEVSTLGGTSTSVLEAPGAEIYGIEAEVTWLATDRLTLGGNFSYTPNEYTKDLYIKDPSDFSAPGSLYPAQDEQVVNINGNRLLQVPDGKATAWASYRWPFSNGSNVELFGTYSWISDVYYSPFENEADKSNAYDRVDLRATWTSGNGNWIVTGFVNNVFDDVGVLQVLRQSEQEFFRHNAGTTVPRLYGVEVTMLMNGF